MVNKQKLYYTLMVLPLIVTVIALFFLPEQIPVHFGDNNEVTRWGSKFETLVFPAVSLIFGGIMMALADSSAKTEKDGSNNKEVVLLGGIIGLLVFNVITFYFLYADFNQVTNLSDIPIDLFSLEFAVLGLGLVLIGNFMPKARMNSLVGFRVSWGMKNETVWKKCQRFAGIAAIVAGILMALGCIVLFRDMAAMGWALALFLLMCVVDLVYAYRISR